MVRGSFERLDLTLKRLGQSNSLQLGHQLPHETTQRVGLVTPGQSELAIDGFQSSRGRQAHPSSLAQLFMAQKLPSPFSDNRQD